MRKFLCIMQSLRILAGVMLFALYCIILGLSMLFMDQFEEIQAIVLVISIIYLILWLIAAIGYGMNHSKLYLAISCVYWSLTFISIFVDIKVQIVKVVLYLLFILPVYSMVSLTTSWWKVLLMITVFLITHFVLYFGFRRMAKNCI